MNEAPDVAPTEKPRWVGFYQGRSWALCGWQRIQGDLPLWLGMASFYLLIAALLNQIPFAGFLLVVMISPILLGSALLALEPGTAAPIAVTPTEQAKRPLRQLLRVFDDESYAYTIVLLSIVTLGLVVILRIAEYLLGVGSHYSLTNVIMHRILPSGWLMLSLLVAIVLNVGLAMGLFFAAHLTVLAKREPLMAVYESFYACMKHGRALAALGGMALLVGIVILIGFHIWSPLGYLLLFTLGTVALAVLVAASHCSFRDIYPSFGRCPPPPL